MRFTNKTIKTAVLIALSALTLPAIAETFEHVAPVKGLRFIGDQSEFASIQLSPSLFQFPTTYVGSSSDLPFTIKNTGNSALIDLRSVISPSGSVFSYASNNCGTSASPISLAAGETCNGIIRFSPSSSSSFSGTLAADAVNSSNGIQSATFSGQGGRSILSSSASPIDFGTYSSGPVVRTVTLTNTGNLPAINTYTVLSGVSSISESASNCGTALTPVNLGAGQSCSLTLSNQGSNSESGQLSIYGYTGGTVSIPVIGTYSQNQIATLSLAPSPSIEFPVTEIGTYSDASFTASNTGNGLMSDVRAILSSSDGKISLLSNTCGATGSTVSLQPNATCSGTLRFSPSDTSVSTGTLAIDSSNASNGVQSVGLSGQGGQSVGQASPSSFAFGTTNGTPVIRTVSISNTGNLPANGFYVEVPSIAGLSTTSNSCGTTGSRINLGAGSSCSVSLTYSGTASLATTVLAKSFTQGDLSIPATASYEVATMTVNPTTGDFPLTETGTSSNITYTVSNTGNIALANVSANVSPTGVYSLVSNSCGTTGSPLASIAAGSSCSVTVRYSPTATVTSNATLTIASTNAINGNQTVSLSGTGGSKIIVAAPTSFDFGVTYDAPTSKTVVFTNTGTMTASNVVATIPALSNVTTNSNTCGTAGSPVSLAPNATCSITLTYSATTTSSVSGTVTVSGATAGLLSVPVTGSNMAFAKLMTTPTNTGVTITSTSVSTSLSTVYNMVLLNRPISSGKHYIEIQDMSYRDFIGLTNLTSNQYSTAGTPSASNYYLDNKTWAVGMYMTNVTANKLAYINSAAGSAVSPVPATTITEADPANPRIFGVAIDADTNKVTWYNEAGVVLGQANVTMAKPWYFAVARGNSNSQGTLNFTLRNSTVLNGRTPSGFTSGIFEQ